MKDWAIILNDLNVKFPRLLDFLDWETESGFICQWTFSTLVGFLVSLIWIEIGERPDLGSLDGAIGGFIISLAQWFILKDHIPHPWRWIFVNVLTWTIIGFTNIGVLGWVAPRTLNLTTRIVYGVIEGIKMGTCLGLGQWWVLRTEVFKPWRWIIASLLSWGVALPIGWMVGGILRQTTGFFLGDVIGLAVAWTIIGLMTGVALVRLLWYPVRLDNW